MQSRQSYGKVRRFLIEHPDLVSKQASWGETALVAARRAGKDDIVQFLLSAGAPDFGVNAGDCDGPCQSTINRL